MLSYFMILTLGNLGQQKVAPIYPISMFEVQY